MPATLEEPVPNAHRHTVAVFQEWLLSTVLLKGLDEALRRPPHLQSSNVLRMSKLDHCLARIRSTSIILRLILDSYIFSFGHIWLWSWFARLCITSRPSSPENTQHDHSYEQADYRYLLVPFHFETLSRSGTVRPARFTSTT